MILPLEQAIAALLRDAVPALFAGDGAVAVGFQDRRWTFAAVSADPVAGEPGPEDAVDHLPFDPDTPAGPYELTRPPYPGPRRVALLSAAGERATLVAAELQWDPLVAGRFSVELRPGRVVAGFDTVEVLYGVLAAGTRLEASHELTLTLTDADPARAEQALVLALAALALGREGLRAAAAFDHAGGSYQARGRLKTLGFVGGAQPQSGVHQVQVRAVVELLVQRLLADDEGRPIERIVSPGREGSGRAVDVDPAVQA